MSSYPGSLDSFTNPTSTDGMNSPSHSDQHADANDAIEAIQAELGTNPSGSFTTVKDRLDDLAGGGGGGGGGLVLIDSATFSAQSSVSVDGCFDSTFDQYRILLRVCGSHSGSNLLAMRVRASASDVTSGYVAQLTSFVTDGSSTTPNRIHTVSGYFPLGYLYNGSPYLSAALDISGPALVDSTELFGTGQSIEYGSGYRSSLIAGHETNGSAVDGFTIYPASGTITGRYSVYGYEK
jgi:hypothetical protein